MDGTHFAWAASVQEGQHGPLKSPERVLSVASTMSPLPGSAVVTLFWGLPDLAFRRPSLPRVESVIV